MCASVCRGFNRLRFPSRPSWLRPRRSLRCPPLVFCPNGKRCVGYKAAVWVSNATASTLSSGEPVSVGTGGPSGPKLCSWKTLTPQMMAAHWPKKEPSDVILPQRLRLARCLKPGPSPEQQEDTQAAVKCYVFFLFNTSYFSNLSSCKITLGSY